MILRAIGWALAYIAVVTIALLATAQRFDHTEVTAIMACVPLFIVIELSRNGNGR